MNANSSTTSKWLQTATRQLETADIDTARLDCLVLLEDATGKDRGYLLAHPETTLNTADLAKLNGAVARRSTHEPLAHIRGKAEFYSRAFKVTHDTLQPRPESETMIDLFKKMTSLYFPHLLEDRHGEKDANFVVVDVGTGTGCIGVTAKLEVPGAQVVLVDVSEDCLGVAQENAAALGANVAFLMGDLLEPVLHKNINVLLCNLPYVPATYPINKAAEFEPGLALFGGDDGLDLYRKMFEQIKDLPALPSHIFTESLPVQHEMLANIAGQANYEVIETQDFVQVFTLKFP